MARVFGLILASVILVLLGCRGADTAAPSEPPRESVREPQPAADGMYAYTSPGELPQLLVLDADGAVSNLPLKHTDVAAQVRGHVAQVRVSQQFHNDRKEPIEVTYTFPLPENSAVDAMRMVIDERVIEAEIQRRADARATYEQARADGYTSALLEQERPNIFTQSVANVPPGETIAVEITYLQTLTQDAGTYEFVFPMVVGPRFVPPGDAGSDAERVLVPVLGEGVRTGHDVSLALDVSLGSSITSWDAPTHTVIGDPTPEGFAVELADAQTIPNRDFVIRWSAAGPSAQARLLLGPKDAKGNGHFALILQPPALDLDELVGRREMIFVVDRSGSMTGGPLALAKQTLREALKRLRPVDTFDVIGFESGTRRLFGTPRPANQDNLVLAERFIDGMQAGGGTMMAGAIEAALAPALTEGRDRYVFFLTDGFISHEFSIFEAASALIGRAEREGVRARVFGVGIGSSPNRYMIENLAEAGDGLALYVGNREDPRWAVEQWSHVVDHPVLEVTEIDWGGLPTASRYPKDLPDLFASHAVVMLGRYAGEVARDITITAWTSDETRMITIPVVVAASEVDDRILATLWAREKIASLSASAWDGDLDRAEAERSITAVGLDFGLVTAFTSFVAVDRSRVVGPGDPLLMVQPVEAPEDVDPVAAGSPFIPSPDSRGLVYYGNDVRSLSYEPEPVAKLSVAGLRASESVDTRAMRRSIIRKSLMFETCYERKFKGRHKARVELRLEFDAAGKLVDIVFHTGTLGNPETDHCFGVVLRGIDWQGLPSERTAVELDLQIRMR